MNVVNFHKTCIVKKAGLHQKDNQQALHFLTVFLNKKSEMCNCDNSGENLLKLVYEPKFSTSLNYYF